LALHPTPKLEDHPLPAVRDCLVNIFAATLHVGGRSSIRNLRAHHTFLNFTQNHCTMDTLSATTTRIKLARQLIILCYMNFPQTPIEVTNSQMNMQYHLLTVVLMKCFKMADYEWKGKLLLHGKNDDFDH